jgi:hypothetical protein
MNGLDEPLTVESICHELCLVLDLVMMTETMVCNCRHVEYMERLTITGFWPNDHITLDGDVTNRRALGQEKIGECHSAAHESR